ncbi:hypothetical protein C900_04881 [Fulvivirga imtechensis AK7]|uniref:Uncharacterized protein n=1 Tax=Fulvivirga imtechensis AK7 TaxID=1237149 RepID=L8JL47_9BACT|nr:hypothetical protein C900_04881 [Fulvivirga imtechensis AK7]
MKFDVWSFGSKITIYSLGSFFRNSSVLAIILSLFLTP